MLCGLSGKCINSYDGGYNIKFPDTCGWFHVENIHHTRVFQVPLRSPKVAGMFPVFWQLTVLGRRMQKER